MFGSRLFLRHIEDDETIVRIVHKHWFFGVREVFWPVLSLVAAWAFFAMTRNPTIFYAACLWSVAGTAWFFRSFYDYYLDAWIITDQGIIDVAWHGWFHRESSRVLYSDIQGVSYEIEGVAGTLFQYGTIAVEKISTGDAISLECVKRPRSVEKIVLKRMEAYLHTKNLSDAKHVQELLAQIVAREMHLGGMSEEDAEDAEESEDADDEDDDEDEEDEEEQGDDEDDDD